MSYDLGFKDGAYAGYKLALEDISKRLLGLGFNPPAEVRNTKETINAIIKFYEDKNE